MSKSLAGLLPTIALILASVGCGANKSSHPVSRPFVANGAFEAGMSGVGDGPSTPTGDHLHCWNGRRYAQNVTMQNRSGVAVTLTGAALDPPSAQIVRRVAVQFRLAPPPPTGDQLVVGLRNWNQSAATPTKIPAGRSAWVQSNFLFQNCGLLQPGHPLITNRSITLNYRTNGHDGSQRLTIPSGRIVVTGRPAVPSVVRAAIKRHLPSNVAYAPTRIPAGWRYVAWDSGRETPGLFPTGKGLNIWFSDTPSSRTPVNGFHVYANQPCSMKGAMKTFRFGRIKVAWSTTYEDSQAWRCASPAVTILVSSGGSGNDPQAIVNRRARAIAEMAASAQQIK